ncbi:hypothetical protein [Paraburkholderia dipogonis]|uniref:hypothetical protein n=1 Tax=Paraburkholderia dipogonis TaxID=1211383 RepID=UPI0038BD9F2E
MTVINALLVICCCIFGMGSAFAECDIAGQTGLKLFSKTGTDAPRNLMPLPEPGKSVPEDCDFYQWAWQTFMFVTQPSQSAGGKPSFLTYPTFEDLFGIKASPLFSDQQAGSLSLAPRGAKLPNGSTEAINDFEQAGLKDVLVDQNGNLVWYAIHLNQDFARFVKDYRLTDPNVLAHIPQNLEFRPGVVELKSAWQIVEGPAPKNFITTVATVPLFKNDKDGKIVKDGTRTRKVTVALLGIHVVGVIEGHPEFIWATFEHVSHKPDAVDANKNWSRDVAPAAASNPGPGNSTVVVMNGAKYALYPGGENKVTQPVISGANKGAPLNGAGPGQKLTLDVQSQKFSPITPIYRLYPGSQEVDGQPDTKTGEDGAVVGQNLAIKKAFTNAGRVESDVRSNYQLVGAVWLNDPSRDLILGQSISDVPPPNPPLKVATFGGENRLSSTTMESFTQDSNASPNCFACHDARHSTAPVGLRLDASLLNVSHVLSKYYEVVKNGEKPASEAVAKPK